MAVQIQLRRDTAANWTGTNPVLAIGEPGVETDTLKVKVGDGATAWNSLAYSISYNFNDLNNKPTTLAGYGITDAATSAQGALADSALQSVPAQSFSSLTGKPTTVAGYGITDAFDGAYGSLSGTPTLGTAAATASTDYATAAQGTTADSAIQPNTSPTLTNATLTGYLAGPASFVIDPAAVGDDTGTVVIAGNLQVDGVQTTINSTTVAIDDLNFSIATDAADAAAANGAGISIGGAGATITYDSTNDEWDFNKPIDVASITVDTLNGGATNFDIKQTTTDGADNKRTRIGGGGDVINTRGAFIELHGNEHTSTGSAVINAGNVTGGEISLRTGGSEKVLITKDGNVGIGTDPSQIFEVEKAADDKLVYGSNPRLLLDTPTGVNGLRVLGDTTPFEFKIDSGTYNGSAFSMGGTGDVSLLGTTTTVSDTFNDSPTFFFNSMRWNGSANATHFQGAIKGHTRSATNGDGYLGIGASASANHLNIETNGTVGVGTTDLDSWSTVFDGRVRLGATGFVGSTSASTQLGNNWYYDGSVYKRIATDYALRYYQNGGDHVWQTAVSAAADSTITWATKMFLGSNGNLEIGYAGADRQQADSQALSIITPSSGGGQGIALKRLDSNSDQQLGEITWSNNTQDGQAGIRVKTEGAVNTTDMHFDVNNAGSAVTSALKIDGSQDGKISISSRQMSIQGMEPVHGTFGIGNYNRRVEVTLGNYESAHVRIMAQRTNGGSCFVYWEGYINNNNSVGYSTAIAQRASDGTVSFTASISGGDFRWDFNASGSSGDGSFVIQGARGGASVDVTTY